MRNLIVLSLLIILASMTFSIKADVATTPANFSCDEMYYSYYYDYEKLRDVYHKFETPKSECNAPVLNWLKDEKTGLENNQFRSYLNYTIEDKDRLFDEFKKLFDIDQRITVDMLRDPVVFKEIMDQASLPPLLTKEDFQEGINQELERQEFFLRLEDKNIDPLKYNQVYDYMKSNFERKWVPPIVGQGAGSTKMKGYYRIDLLGEPIDLSKAWDMKCANIYRGFNNTCEQDCSYMRNIAIDIQAKMRLWQQQWDWENHKMLCTPQSTVKGSVMPFDAPFCRLSCPGGEVSCSTCSYKLDDEQEKPYALTCLSEYDAKHAADLFCFLNGREEGCAQVSCNTSQNIHEDVPNTITARNEYTETFSREHSIGFETSANLQGGTIQAGVEVSGNIKLGISGALHIYSNESATLIDKFFTERSDGKLFECPREFSENKTNFTCEQLDRSNPRYQVDDSHSSCGTDKNEKEYSFGQCLSHKMGEGRAFFNCEASIEEVKDFEGKGYAGMNFNGKLPLIGGTQMEVYGNTQHGFDFATTISASSKEFNAGGLSLRHMKKTCERWQDQWLSVTFNDQSKDKWIINLDPLTHFDTQSLPLSTSDMTMGTRVSCTIKDESGVTKVAEIASLEGRIAMVNSNYNEQTHSGTSQVLKKKVFQLGMIIKQKSGSFGRISDWLATDTFYPPATPPLEKNYFSYEFKNRYVHYLSSLMQANMDSQSIASMLSDLTPVRQGSFELRNCKVQQISKDRRPGPGHTYVYRKEDIH